MSVNMSVFYTLYYIIKLKKNVASLRSFVSHNTNCAIWDTAFAGLGSWWPCCICVYISPVTGQRPELGHFSPFQNQSWRCLTKPCVIEICYSHELILLSFYLPVTF